MPAITLRLTGGGGISQVLLNLDHVIADILGICGKLRCRLNAAGQDLRHGLGDGGLPVRRPGHVTGKSDNAA
ncbi:MAG: hypothetical protein ACJ8AW_05615 [Rhodopila sp.]